MRHLLRRCSVGVCLLAAVLGLRHEGATVLAQESAPPAFPSQVEIVTVDAVVVDVNGKSVEGLTKSDFVLEEDGQPQEVVNFEAVSVSPEPASTVRATEPSSIAVSNVADRKARRAFAILADDLRLPGEESLQVRRVIGSFLAQSLGPGDAVILGTTSGEAWWSARMPEGREDLLAVLEHLKGRYVDPSTREHMTEYEAFWITHREAGSPTHQPVLEALRNPGSVSERVAVRLWDKNMCGVKFDGAVAVRDYENCFPMVRSAAADIDGARRQRTSLTLRAMARAVNALRSFHGRASLVFLSPGFLQDEDLTQQDLATAALEAHTAVYFVDSRGLITGALGPATPSDASSLEHPGRETQRRREELDLESGGAQALAEETGGFSVRNTNDLAAAAERIAAESRTFYLLGFRPPSGKGAKAWRKLRVTVNRSGVTIRARRGYRLDAVTTAAMRPSGTDATIPLRLASYVLEPLVGDRTRVVTVTEIDISALPAPKSSDEPSPALQLRLEATPRDGGQTLVQDVSLQSARGSASESARTAPAWRLARLEFALPAGVHGIRSFARDPTTGRTAVAEQRIVVPEQTAFRLSTPVLSDQLMASGDAKAPPLPAPVAHDEFRPSPSRPLLASSEVLGAAHDPNTGRPKIETRVVLEDRAGKTVAAPPATALAPSAEGRLQLVLALPPLPGGEYDLVIRVDDRVAGRSQEVRRSFKVEGTTPAIASAPPPSRVGPAPVITPELAGILDRAGQYVLAYGQDFSDILADEVCQQVLEPDDPGRRAVRNTRAGVIFVTLPGPLPWATFRDVWEVDGNKIHDREERLGKLLGGSLRTGERARALLEESARYNLGPLHRTMNIPTLALLFFHPDNQGRFAFELKGKQSIQGTRVVELAFRERGRPTLVQGNTSEGAPVKGRAWIDPEHGTVLKTDAEYDTDPQDHNHRSRARIVTEYRREPALGMLVPDRMKETYQWLAVVGTGLKVHPNAHTRSVDAQEESGVYTIEGTTQYSAYHRFGVTTEETFRPTPKKPN